MGDNCQIQNPLTEELSSWKEGKHKLRWVVQPFPKRTVYSDDCALEEGKNQTEHSRELSVSRPGLLPRESLVEGLAISLTEAWTRPAPGAAPQLCSRPPPLPFTRITVHWSTSAPASSLLSYRYFLQSIFYMSILFWCLLLRGCLSTPQRKIICKDSKILRTLFHHLLKYLHYLTHKKIGMESCLYLKMLFSSLVP